MSLVLSSGIKMFFFLSQVSNPGCASFSDAGSEVRVLSDWLASCSSCPFYPTNLYLYYIE